MPGNVSEMRVALRFSNGRLDSLRPGVHELLSYSGIALISVSPNVGIEHLEWVHIIEAKLELIHADPLEVPPCLILLQVQDVQLLHQFVPSVFEETLNCRYVVEEIPDFSVMVRHPLKASILSDASARHDAPVPLQNVLWELESLHTFFDSTQRKTSPQ